MSVFKKPATVEYLKKKSNSILDVFTKTVSELTSVNEEITSVSEEKATEKARLEADLAILSLQKDENNRVIKKIEQIFQ